MDHPVDEGRLSLLVTRLPPNFRRHVVILPAGDDLPYEPERWHDALVVVEQGEIEIEAPTGRTYRFSSGAVLCLDGLDARRFRNTGGQTAILVAVSRRRTNETRGAKTRRLGPST